MAINISVDLNASGGFSNPSSPSSSSESVRGPLSTLYDSSATDVNLLKYPSSLGSDQKNHYVQLYIKNVESAGYESNKLQAIPTSGINIGNLISEGGIFDAAAGLAQTVKNVIFGDSTLKTLFNENLSLSFTPQTSRTVSVISLYMPDTLTAAYNASYDSLSLTNDLGATAKTAQAIATAGGQLSSGGNIASIGPAALVAGEQSLSGLANKASLNYKNISDLLLKGQGVAINPQMQMIYRGTNFRSFQLTFMFTPSTKAEAETVNKIVNTLKYHFSPTLASGATSNQSMFLIPPSIFGIKFKLGENENKFLPKYGDCVLENIDVDNAPNGWASYEDGAPVQTRLTLQFKEIVILDRGKVRDGVNEIDGGLR